MSSVQGKCKAYRYNILVARILLHLHRLGQHFPNLDNSHGQTDHGRHERNIIPRPPAIVCNYAK